MKRKATGMTTMLKSLKRLSKQKDLELPNLTLRYTYPLRNLICFREENEKC